MRDVHDFNKSHTALTYDENRTVVGSTTVQRKVTRSQRSESTPTVPSSTGSYYFPTSYSAFFSTTSTVPGKCQYEYWNWPFRAVDRKVRDREWDGWTDHGEWKWGIDATNLQPKMPTKTISEARAKAIDQVRNNDWSAGQSLAEMRETIAGVANLVNGLLNMLRVRGIPPALKFGGRRVDQAKAAASGYLTIQYGIMPVINDIYQLLSLLSEGIGSGDFVNVRGIAMDTSYSGPTYGYLSYERTAVGTFTRGVEVGLTYRLTNPAAYQLWRYGLTDPLTLAWELVPLSFVVDWFLNVKGFISGLSVIDGLHFSHGYETKFLKNQFVLREQMWPPEGGPSRYKVLKPGYAETTIHTKSMARYGLLWTPPPLPYLQVKLNPSQAVSAIALVVAALR